MGAAGLTSSSAEMAARGDVGVTIDTTKVPVREDGHDAVRDPAQRIAGAHARRRASADARTRCAAILEKWDLTAAVIGEVIAEPVYRVTEGERVVAEFPGIAARHRLPDVHAGGARERRDRARCARATCTRSPSARRSAIPCGRSSGCSRRRRSRARRGCIASTTRPCARTPSSARAATRRWFACAAPTALALKTDCNGRYVLSRSARRRADRRCRGRAQRRVHRRAADGDHEQSQLRQSEAPRGLLPAPRGRARHGRGVRGARHAGHRRQRLALQRESRRARCIPTPVIGMVGLIDSTRAHHARRTSSDEGDAIVLLGETDRRAGRRASISRAIHGVVAGAPPRVRSRREKRR